MPKRPAATKGFPCKPEDCYVSRHLEGPDYKIYDLMRAAAPLKNGKRMFYAPVRPWLCNAANQSETAVSATLKRLEKAGWVIKHEGQRRPDGKKTSNTYEIIEHEAFAAKHPNSCPPYEYAPNFEEAEKYGVSRGEKRKHATALPKNFWPTTLLGRALFKITGEEPAIMSDEEMQALSEHFAMHGPPELVAMHGQQEPCTVDRSRAMHGQQELPCTVDGNSHARLTVQNPSKPILENTTHTPTPYAAAKMADSEAEECVSVLILKADQDWNWAPPGIKTVKPAMKELAKQHGRELFLRAGRNFISDPPPSINAKTYSHWDKFVSGFALYLGRSKPKEVTPPEQIAKAYEIARQRHEEMWAIKQPSDEGGTPEDFLASAPTPTTVDELRTAIAVMEFKPIADQNLRELEERKAKAEADGKALDKKIEDGNF